MSGERLRWTPDELDLLFAPVVQMMLANENLNLFSAVDIVQKKVLRPERQRVLKNIGLVPTTLRFRIENAVAAARGGAPTEQAYREQVQLRESAEQREGVLQAKLHEASGRISALESEVAALRARPNPATPLDALKLLIRPMVEEFLEELRGVPGDRPHGMTLESLIAIQGDARPPLQKPLHDGEPSSNGKKRPPVVLIVGMKPERRAHFESTYAGRVRFRFWWSDGSANPAGIDPKAKGSDIVYCLMGACSHQEVEHCVRNHDRVERVARWSNDELKLRIDAFLKSGNWAETAQA